MGRRNSEWEVGSWGTLKEDKSTRESEEREKWIVVREEGRRGSDRGCLRRKS